jgi:hypothetical protein
MRPGSTDATAIVAAAASAVANESPPLQNTRNNQATATSIPTKWERHIPPPRRTSPPQRTLPPPLGGPSSKGRGDACKFRPEVLFERLLCLIGTCLVTGSLLNYRAVYVSFVCALLAWVDETSTACYMSQACMSSCILCATCLEKIAK